MTNELIWLLLIVMDILRPDEESDLATSLFGLAIVILILAGLWRVFQKASQPGWACLVPVYAEITLLKVVGKPWWWVFFLVIPFVGAFPQIILLVFLVGRFGKDIGYYLGVVFLPFIFLPLLGFGSAPYKPPFRRSPRLTTRRTSA